MKANAIAPAAYRIETARLTLRCFDLSDARAVKAIDHGVIGGLALSADRWVLAYDDGTLVVLPLAARRSGDLTAAIARATTYRL